MEFIAISQRIWEGWKGIQKSHRKFLSNLRNQNTAWKSTAILQREFMFVSFGNNPLIFLSTWVITIKKAAHPQKSQICSGFSLSTPSPDALRNFIEKSEHNEKIRNICAGIPTIQLNDEIIQRKITSLPDNMVAGPDDLPNLFIERCGSSFLEAISKRSVFTAVESNWPIQQKSCFHFCRPEKHTLWCVNIYLFIYSLYSRKHSTLVFITFSDLCYIWIM